MKEQPIDRIAWVPRETLKPNGYNPNMVAPPELRLLRISIIEDGWTQPIVVTRSNDIVDGFHRWTVSSDVSVSAMTDGLVPVVVLDEKDGTSLRMATIRHNRARGTHAVLKMADIVADMIQTGVCMEEICERMQMEPEEVVRLANRNGIPKTEIITGAAWSRSWNPK